MSWEFNNYGGSPAETMANLFNYCSPDYNATVEGCQTIIDEWKPKADKFDELFKDFPGFNKELHCLVLDTRLFRSINPHVIVKFFDDFMYGKMMDNVLVRATIDGKNSEEWREEYRRLRSLLNHINLLPAFVLDYHGVKGLKVDCEKAYHNYLYLPDFTEESRIEKQKRIEVYDKLKDYYVQFCNEELAEFLNDRVEKLKAVAGQKMSKLVRKLCKLYKIEADENLEREFAKYADAINPIELNETLIISWNIFDFLTMSFGKSWTSCHSIDKFNVHEYTGRAGNYGGSWSSGTLSYGQDGSSIIVYTITKEDKESGVPYWNLPKVHRQMFHISENGEGIVQSRLYPDDQTDCGNSTTAESYTQYREIVQHIVAQAFNIPNLWVVKRDREDMYEHTATSGTHYKDYLSYSNTNLSVHQNATDKPFKIYIGSAPHCPACGRKHNDENWCTCYDCRGRHKCYSCGEYIEDDRAHYMEDGNWYCEDCLEWCEYHEEYELGDLTYIEDYGHVCDEGISAMIRDEELFECEQCGDYCRSGYEYKIEYNGVTHYFDCRTCRDNWIDNNVENEEDVIIY